MIQYLVIEVHPTEEGKCIKYYDGWYLFGLIPIYRRRISAAMARELVR